MALILIIALFVGGGTSFAAENALPGDTLYPVKISVNEEIRNFIAISDEARADWNARRAERRLEEAEKLAIEGRFNTETRADLESRLESHVEAFAERAEKIEAKQDTRASFEIHSNFEASLEAHERVLALIAEEKAEVRGEVESFLIGVRTRLNAISRARSNAEAKVSSETGVQFKTAAEGKLRAAENKIREVRGFLARIKMSVSASSHADAEAELKVAENVVARGKTEMEAETYGKTFISFQEALRIAQEAKLLVATEERINLEANLGDGDTRNDSERERSSGTSLEVESRSNATGTEGRVEVDIGL